LALASLAFYGRPDRKLRITGVTGTNGKTTTVHLVDAICRAAGKTTACLGTIEHRVGARRAAAVNTTPESLDVVRYLAELVGIGGTHAAMEVSSHGLELRRIFGLEFACAVFTNLTQDHLDLHGSMENYFGAKRRLFEGAGARPPLWGVVNVDDALAWHLTRPEEERGKLKAGIAPEKEAAVLAAWKAKKA
jgi:UDP-N-acetylmuramoyl-L-alanyl-D-glutamate--2,6-diaminopimelate ligase